MTRAQIDQESRRIHEQLLRGPEKWVHHVVDLTRDGQVLTSQHDRPIAMFDRLERLSDVLDVKLPDSFFALSERILTPRAPYQESPLSYLNAGGRSWSLWAEADRLEWAEFGAADARYGGIEFWFRDVTPGVMRVVSISVTAGATGPGVTGNLEVRSSDAAPRTFSFTGFADQILDVVVRPSNEFAVLVTLEPKDGVGYLAFREITYGTLPFQGP